MPRLRVIQPGEVIGEFVYLGEAGKKGNLRACKWKCKCGNECVIRLCNVVTGRQRGCGCNRADGRRRGAEKQKTHGMTNTAECNIWRTMRNRCTNTNNKDYWKYGGRGIKVCDRWNEAFMNFYLDMGPRPSPSHSVDRINNDGNYEPENCRWATKIEQGNNRRNCVYLEHNGEKLTAADWSRKTGISPSGIRLRIKRGLSIEAALSPVLHTHRNRKP